MVVEVLKVPLPEESLWKASNTEGTAALMLIQPNYPSAFGST